jgi:hypothetical protein
MKKALLILTSLTVFAGLAAASVTYQSSGVFNCTNGGNLSGCGTSVLDFGTAPSNNAAPDIVLTFAGEVSNTVTPVTGGGFGDLILSCGDTLTDCGSEALSAGITLTITIDQTSPIETPAALSIDASFNPGTLTENSTGTVAVIWLAQSSVGFADGTAYAIGPLNQPLIPPSSGGLTPGDLSLQGTITTVSNLAPEPATFGLMGAALVGLGFLARKRKA